MKGNKKSKKDTGYMVRCIRCGQTSRVDLVAKCGHCGSFAVKVLKKKT